MNEADALLRLRALLETVAVEKRPCRFCGKPLYFVPTRAGKVAPYTAEGRNHFEDCPRFQRAPAPKEQQRLFESTDVAAFDPER